MTLQRVSRCRGVLLVLALLSLALLNLVVPDETAAQETSKPAAAALLLPSRTAEIAPFLAKMDDQQARATLARVLEDRTQPSEPERKPDLLMDFEHATARLGTRLAQISAASPEAASAPTLFWRWLTAAGTDPTAPLRALAGAALIIAICWGAQAAAVAGLQRRALTGQGVSSRARAAIIVFRWMVFLTAIAVTHALVPEVTRPSRLTALAIVLTFAGTWIASRAIGVVLPALHGEGGTAVTGGVPLKLLCLALSIFFAGLFGLALLREAGMSDDARLLFGLALWLAFGLFFLLGFRRRGRSPAIEEASGTAARADPIERLLARHGRLLLRLSFIGILVAATVFALLRGPQAFWSGIGSLGLLGILVAALGLTRTPLRPTAASEAAAPSPWTAMTRRGLRLLILVAFVLLLAALWEIDLFHTANTHLGDRVARGIVTIGVTVVLSYLVWEVVTTALAQSALGPPRTEVERGEEGSGTVGTRLQTFGPVLRNFLFVVVVTVAAMVCLSALGVDIGPLLAGAGVIGIALGFGAQTLVRDIISGVFFLAEDAFRTGEYIEIGNTRGTVEGIAIRSLKLRHHRGAVHTVPFGEIKQLTNHSRDWIIMKLEFLLAFETDLTKVKRIVKEIGKELAVHPELGHALLDSVKSQGVQRMEPTGMVVGLKFMAKPGSEVFILRREVYQRVRDAFEQNGIRFARPQVMVAGSGEDALAQIAATKSAAATLVS